MTGQRESKKRAVRKALYDAAVDLIERDGYDAVSVDQIVAAAGVAKGTFFNHFPGKADLLADWYLQVIEISLEETPDAAALALPDRLAALALRSIQGALASPHMWQAKHAHALATPSIQTAERKTDAALRTAIARMIAQARHRDELPDRVDPEAMADLVVTLVTGTIRESGVTGRLDAVDARIADRIGRLCELAGYRPLAEAPPSG
jgi:AcrR family transcriptional regulator